MHGFIVQAIAAAAGVALAMKLVPGVRANSTQTVAVVAFAFAVLNALLGWLIKFLAVVLLLPAALLTFGLVYLFLGFLVNAVVLWLADRFIEEFELETTNALLSTAGLITVAAWLLERIF